MNGKFLTEVGNNAVLCHVPVKRESLKTDHDTSQADQQLEFFAWDSVAIMIH